MKILPLNQLYLPVLMQFLSQENLCGQNLIRIASRSSSIIAELLRLSANIPEIFLVCEDKDSADADPVLRNFPEQRKYLRVVYDFHYFKEPEEYEKRINENSELLDLDQEFQENHQDILRRFYMLFQSIWKFQSDFAKFIEDVLNGFYLQHSLHSILREVAGCQLLCETLYLYGIILLLLEEKIPGYVRERLIIAIYRINCSDIVDNMEEICKLCRNTGYIPGSKQRRPKNHPEMLFARFPPNPELVKLVIGQLLTEDIYLMNSSFPNPVDRSTRLSTQAAMLYVILYFAPEILHKQKVMMREIVDKYFNDNWVIATYMGHIVDLNVEWAVYPAAKSALDNLYNSTTVRQMHESNAKSIERCFDDLKVYLKEGVLQQEFLLDNISELLNCVRICNITLRWRLMHRKTKVEAFQKIVDNDVVSKQMVVTLLLNTSQLEYILKGMLQKLLNEKDKAWTTDRESAVERMNELSNFFSGDKALTRVKRDENMMKWFASLANEVDSLNIYEGHATVTGRKIQGIIAALEDVEQFEAVDTNVQIKSFLNEARDIFRTMIRTVNIKSELLSVLETVSDLSYAWQTLNDYIPVLHERISKDPNSVVLLRATFLKAASILDLPLVRISAIDSPDAVSVAAYYSGELVEFVREVLEVIPVSIFKILDQIISIQTSKMLPLSIRMEAQDLKDCAQLDVRCELAKLTHEVSIFTEGILVMEKTLLGVIQVEPRQILEEGLRRELVRLICFALNKHLNFKDKSQFEVNKELSRVAVILEGLKKSIEYIQDYVAIAGLKIYQQEFSRIISYFTEQEANQYLKKKIFDGSSRYQSKSIPIPRLSDPLPSSIDVSSGPISFMGRVLESLFSLTDPTKTVYAPESMAWFEHPAPDQKRTPTLESCGIRTFALLETSIGVIGLRGLYQLLAFRTVHTFNSFLKFYELRVPEYQSTLGQVGFQI